MESWETKWEELMNEGAIGDAKMKWMEDNEMKDMILDEFLTGINDADKHEALKLFWQWSARKNDSHTMRAVHEFMKAIKDRMNGTEERDEF